MKPQFDMLCFLIINNTLLSGIPRLYSIALVACGIPPLTRTLRGFDLKLFSEFGRCERSWQLRQLWFLCAGSQGEWNQKNDNRSIHHRLVWITMRWQGINRLHGLSFKSASNWSVKKHRDKCITRNIVPGRWVCNEDGKAFPVLHEPMQTHFSVR